MKKYLISLAVLPILALGQIGNELHFSSTGKPLRLSVSGHSLNLVKNPSVSTAQTNAFHFNIEDTSAKTSAAVYDQNDSLVRTLWSGLRFPHGRVDSFWNGLDDNGVLVKNATYKIRVAKTNVKMVETWGIGNSSKDSIGSTHYNSDVSSGMEFAGSKGFVFPAYKEGNYDCFSFARTDIGRKQSLGNFRNNTTFKTCSDGEYVYGFSYDLYAPAYRSFFFAYDSLGNQVTFSSGQSIPPYQPSTFSVKYNHNDPSFAYQSDTAIQNTGCVSKGSIYFYTCRSDGKIDVYNKKTGAFIKQDNTQTFITSTMLSRGSATCDNVGNIWLGMTVGGVVRMQLLLMDGTGSISSLGIYATGNNYPISMKISPDGSTLLTVDASKLSQQIKAFNTSDATLAWTLGDAGGYYTDANVTYTKFDFYDDWRQKEYGYVSYQPDGSFWVGDNGNYRILHFSANGVYIDQICWLPSAYTVAVDENNPNHVYNDFLRYDVDYSNPDLQHNWTLTKNYSSFFSAGVESFESFHRVTTLLNAKTYATLRYVNNLQQQLGELTDTGFRVSPTSIYFQNDMDKNGSIITLDYIAEGVRIQENKINSFDGSNFPVYAGAQTYCIMPYRDSFPFGVGGNLTARLGDGTYVAYGSGVRSGMHIGTIAKNGTKYNGQAAHSTYIGYEGPPPMDGSYDIRYNINNDDGICKAIDSFIVYHPKYENFMSSGQANIWTLSDKYLLVLDVEGNYQWLNYDPGEAAYFNAGNSQRGWIVFANGDYWIYYGDESRKGEIHRVKLTNRKVTYDLATVTINGTPPAAQLPYVDLMANFPHFSGFGQTDTLGWHFDFNSDYSFYTSTNDQTYQRNLTPDLRINSNVAGKTVSRSIPFDGSDWKLFAIKTYPGGGNNNYQPWTGGSMYETLYDDAGRIIYTMQRKMNQDGSMVQVTINNTVVYQQPNYALQPLFYTDIKTVVKNIGTDSISYSFLGNTVTVPLYDGLANVMHPAKWTVETHDLNAYMVYDIQKFWFYP